MWAIHVCLLFVQLKLVKYDGEMVVFSFNCLSLWEMKKARGTPEWRSEDDCTCVEET